MTAPGCDPTAARPVSTGTGPARVRRRAVLAGGLAVLSAVVAGCGRDGGTATGLAASATPTTPATSDDALTDAAGAEQALIAAFDHAIATARGRAKPALLAARAGHAVHLQALRQPAAATGPEVKDITTALQASVTTLQAAARGEADGGHAALLASIAAAHQAALS